VIKNVLFFRVGGWARPFSPSSLFLKKNLVLARLFLGLVIRFKSLCGPVPKWK
jgi:hypothetical protein